MIQVHGLEVITALHFAELCRNFENCGGGDGGGGTGGSGDGGFGGSGGGGGGCGCGGGDDEKRLCSRKMKTAGCQRSNMS